MSRVAPFLIDDLNPSGPGLLGVRPVNCRDIPKAALVVATVVAAASAERFAARLRALAAEGGPAAVLVAAEGRAAADAAVAALVRQGLPGLVLVVDGQGGCDWIARLLELAARLAPAARLQAVAEPRGAAVLRPLAGRRILAPWTEAGGGAAHARIGCAQAVATSGQAASFSEMTATSRSQRMPKAGSSQRTPASAPGV